MKRHLLFLAVVACLSLSSVTSNASPPLDATCDDVPTIKQMAPVQMPIELTITPIAYAWIFIG